jgi:hypothetical protein
MRKGFKIEEDKNTSDTYTDDPFESDEDDAWDEDEVSIYFKILLTNG